MRIWNSFKKGFHLHGIELQAIKRDAHTAKVILDSTTQVSSMIHSARPIVSPAANIV